MNRSKDWEPEIHCQDSSSADGWGAPWRNAPFCVERIPTVVLLIRPSTQPRNSGQTGHVVRYGSEIKRNAKLLDLMFNFMRQNWKRRWVKASLEEQETSGRGGDIQQVVTSRSLFMALTEMLPPPPPLTGSMRGKHTKEHHGMTMLCQNFTITVYYWNYILYHFCPRFHKRHFDMNGVYEIGWIA